MAVDDGKFAPPFVNLTVDDDVPTLWINQTYSVMDPVFMHLPNDLPIRPPGPEWEYTFTETPLSTWQEGMVGIGNASMSITLPDLIDLETQGVAITPMVGTMAHAIYIYGNASVPDNSSFVFERLDPEHLIPVPPPADDLILAYGSSDPPANLSTIVWTVTGGNVTVTSIKTTWGIRTNASDMSQVAEYVPAIVNGGLNTRVGVNGGNNLGNLVGGNTYGVGTEVGGGVAGQEPIVADHLILPRGAWLSYNLPLNTSFVSVDGFVGPDIGWGTTKITPRSYSAEDAFNATRPWYARATLSAEVVDHSQAQTLVIDSNPPWMYADNSTAVAPPDAAIRITGWTVYSSIYHPPDKPKSINKGAVAGGVVGGIVGLALLGLLLCCLCRRHRRKPQRVLERTDFSLVVDDELDGTMSSVASPGAVLKSAAAQEERSFPAPSFSSMTWNPFAPVDTSGASSSSWADATRHGSVRNASIRNASIRKGPRPNQSRPRRLINPRRVEGAQPPARREEWPAIEEDAGPMEALPPTLPPTYNPAWMEQRRQNTGAAQPEVSNDSMDAQTARSPLTAPPMSTSSASASNNIGISTSYLTSAPQGDVTSPVAGDAPGPSPGSQGDTVGASPSAPRATPGDHASPTSDQPLSDLYYSPGVQESLATPLLSTNSPDTTTTPNETQPAVTTRGSNDSLRLERAQSVVKRHRPLPPIPQPQTTLSRGPSQSQAQAGTQVSGQEVLADGSGMMYGSDIGARDDIPPTTTH